MKDLNFYTYSNGETLAYVLTAKKIKLAVSPTFTITINANANCKVKKINKNLYKVIKPAKGGSSVEWIVTEEELDFYFKPNQ
jgi:hypothetical protein